MDPEPICLRLGLSLGPVETLPNIIIQPNPLCLSMGIALGISVGQCNKPYNGIMAFLHRVCDTVL